jgi:hypothetical protein
MPVVDNERISFSQYCSKQHFSVFGQFLLEQKQKEQIMGVSFYFNEARQNESMVLNSRRNARFTERPDLKSPKQIQEILDATIAL